MNRTRNLLMVLPAVLFLSVFLSAQEPAKKDTVKKAEVQELFRLKTVEPFFYCAVEMTGSYEQTGKAFETMYQEAGAQGVDFSSAPVGIYWNSPNDTPAEKLKWEVGMQMPSRKELKAPLVVKKWEFLTLATTEFKGAFGSPEMGKTYGALFGWIGKNQYTVCGPLMETYLDMPVQDAEGRWTGRVEIAIPVMKK